MGFWCIFFGRFSAVALAAGWILLTGFIRLLVGAHDLTDVLAGYAIGLAWVILAVRLVERFFEPPPICGRRLIGGLGWKIRIHP